MELKELDVEQLIPYENNPRKNDQAVDKVALSISSFGFKVPIVIDKNNVIVAGHTRLKAAKKLGLKKVPCIMADDLTDEQIKQFRLADNKVAEMAEWDEEKLQKELEEIDIDMSLYGFDELEKEIASMDTGVRGSLVDRFGVPPFSVIDGRQGYWNERKRLWKEKGLQSNLGREENLTFGGLNSDYMADFDSQTSVFDPALTELMYRWFCPKEGMIFDCFAGGAVRGIVAEMIGYKYIGIDLREEQIDENYRQAMSFEVSPKWYCDDSKNADKYIENDTADMLFTCPPYADLEVYSDDERDISNMEYDDFKIAYKEILSVACRKLKNNRFAAIVVGDVRDKGGVYRRFVDYTKECFVENGLSLYNDIVYIEPVGTAAVRAPKLFTSSRKVVKTHQNILVFYKGDTKAIKENYGDVYMGEETDESKME